MGCDYYIITELHIYYNNQVYYSTIELSREKCYFTDIDCDSDEEGYEEKIEKYKEYILTPKMAPIIIYINDNFTKLLFETKYKELINTELSINNKKWLDIVKIEKVETRHERS